ncbi:MAG: FliM/FliN family flagellar motor switch protein [Woeseia sp.]
MTEQVLTDDEKNALLDGVNSGAVQVQSNGGSVYASVRPFEIASRSRVVTNSFPRMRTVNARFAAGMSRQAETMLQRDVDIKPLGIEMRLFNQLGSEMTSSAVVVVFEAPPLNGTALIVLRPELVGLLVDAFFGGPGSTGSGAAGGTFSAGELSVSKLFCQLVLSTVQESWQPLLDFKLQQVATETSLDHVELSGESDLVIETGFEMTIADHRGQFYILWPRDTVLTLLPAFGGEKCERDAAKDALWEQAIRQRVADVSMKITTCVGHASTPVSDLAGLSAGDVVNIDSPGPATIFAGSVPVIKGKFGILEGRNAVEATHWLMPRNGSVSLTGL